MRQNYRYLKNANRRNSSMMITIVSVDKRKKNTKQLRRLLAKIDAQSSRENNGPNTWSRSTHISIIVKWLFCVTEIHIYCEWEKWTAAEASTSTNDDDNNNNTVHKVVNDSKPKKSGSKKLLCVCMCCWLIYKTVEFGNDQSRSHSVQKDV